MLHQQQYGQCDVTGPVTVVTLELHDTPIVVMAMLKV